MRDPFPIPPIPALSRAIQPLADRLGLTTLPLHIHEVIIVSLFYTFVQQVVSPLISNTFCPHLYGKLSRGKRVNWDAHVVSLIQSLVVNGLALWCMLLDQERRSMNTSWEERIWGYTGAAGMVQAFAAGYFVWDFVVTFLNLDVFGLGLLAHATSALTVFSFGYRPFLNYYGSNFILYELSTPFLNFHWFFDKLNMTGSKAQLYNGIILICTFFSCRLIYGNYQSFMVYRDMWNAVRQGPSASAQPVSTNPNYDIMAFAGGKGPIPIWLFVIYTASNTVLNSLNIHWFFKMIAAVRKRFEPARPAKGASGANGANGTSATEAEKKSACAAAAAASSGVDGALDTTRHRSVKEMLTTSVDDMFTTSVGEVLTTTVEDMLTVDDDLTEVQ